MLVPYLCIFNQCARAYIDQRIMQMAAPIAAENRVLQKLLSRDQPLEFLRADKVIVAAVLFAGARLARGVCAYR